MEDVVGGGRDGKLRRGEATLAPTTSPLLDSRGGTATAGVLEAGTAGAGATVPKGEGLGEGEGEAPAMKVSSNK